MSVYECVYVYVCNACIHLLLQQLMGTTYMHCVYSSCLSIKTVSIYILSSSQDSETCMCLVVVTHYVGSSPVNESVGGDNL